MKVFARGAFSIAYTASFVVAVEISKTLPVRWVTSVHVEDGAPLFNHNLVLLIDREDVLTCAWVAHRSGRCSIHLVEVFKQLSVRVSSIIRELMFDVINTASS